MSTLRRRRGLRPDPLDALGPAPGLVPSPSAGVVEVTVLKEFAAEAVVGDADSASTTVPKVGLTIPFDGLITSVEVVLNRNQVCGATSLIVDVHKILSANKGTDGQGTTLYTTQGNRPTVTSGNRYVSGALPDVRTVEAGDVLTFYVDQVGTSVTNITIIVTGDRI